MTKCKHCGKEIKIYPDGFYYAYKEEYILQQINCTMQYGLHEPKKSITAVKYCYKAEPEDTK